MDECNFSPMLHITAEGVVEGDYWEAISRFEMEHWPEYVHRHEQLEKDEFVRATRTLDRKPKHKSGGNYVQYHKSQNEKRAMLYIQGKSDGEIAQQCGCTRTAVESWRRYRGLKLNPCQKDHLNLRMELYKQGLTDKQLAKECSVALQTIRTWRKRNGLEENQPVGDHGAGK